TPIVAHVETGEHEGAAAAHCHPEPENPGQKKQPDDTQCGDEQTKPQQVAIHPKAGDDIALRRDEDGVGIDILGLRMSVQHEGKNRREKNYRPEHAEKARMEAWLDLAPL